MQHRLNSKTMIDYNGGRPVYTEKTGLSFSQNSYGTTSSVSNAMYNMVYSSKASHVCKVHLTLHQNESFVKMYLLTFSW